MGGESQAPGRIIAAGLTLLPLLACNVASSASLPQATPLPSATPRPESSPTPIETPTMPPPSEWEFLAPGVEMRTIHIPVTGPNLLAETQIIRVEPSLVSIRVRYDPRTPTTVSGWHVREGAMLTVNGGFFERTNATLGLLVSDGQVYGESFLTSGNAGMFTLRGDEIDLRSLAQFPYSPAETFDQALQGRPMLLYPGRFPVQFDLSAETSRRTALGRDAQGRLLILSHSGGLLSLYDLRDWMSSNEEVPFEVALNLDGGESTGLAITTRTVAILSDSRTAIPSVITITPRELQ